MSNAPLGTAGRRSRAAAPTVAQIETELRNEIARLGLVECAEEADEVGVAMALIAERVGPNVPVRIEDLLRRRGEAFIFDAYCILLGRAPDPDGEAHHLARLAAGRTRVEIVHDIRYSVEGCAVDRKVLGLRMRHAGARILRSLLPRWGSRR